MQSDSKPLDSLIDKLHVPVVNQEVRSGVAAAELHSVEQCAASEAQNFKVVSASQVPETFFKSGTQR